MMKFGWQAGRWQRCAAPVSALVLILFALQAAADIPATPVMTVYKFNGDVDLPFYHVEAFERRGAFAPDGTLAQGTTLIPCLMIRAGQPLTDRSGTPFVGYEIVVDARRASRDSPARVTEAIARRKTLTVPNHHCPRGVRHVIDVRNLYAMEKVPFFDPPWRVQSAGGESESPRGPAPSQSDQIVRAFHNSAQCAQANQKLIGRRAALHRAWDGFTRDSARHWSAAELVKARHLDYAMRTALFEGHLQRGCSAYGACERNVVVLSIRNRAIERCLGREGCRGRGDFEGVASTPSQYNIWDEYLTQISGLTACYLRDDLAGEESYRRLQGMYAQNVGDVQRILFGSEADLAELFPGVPLTDVKRMAHYYHAPAMGKCFPQYDRVEYMSGAVARDRKNFALIANMRIQVGDKVGDDYRFRSFRFEETDARDVVTLGDEYAGYTVDGRKVALVPTAGCVPYGIPAGCSVGEVGRYRRTPAWLSAGKPLGLSCSIADRAESCAAPPRRVSVQVGGACDTQMRPVSGVN